MQTSNSVYKFFQSIQPKSYSFKNKAAGMHHIYIYSKFLYLGEIYFYSL